MAPIRQKIGFIILIFLDIVILFLFVHLAISFREAMPSCFPSFRSVNIHQGTYWRFIPLWILILFYEGAYTRKFTFWDEIKLLWRVSFFATIAILTVLFLGKTSLVHSRTVIILTGIFSFCFFPLARIAYKRLLIRSGMLKSRVLILGTGLLGARALEALRREPNLGYEVVGFIDDQRAREQGSHSGVKIYRRLQQVERYIRTGNIQDVVIALEALDKKRLSGLINHLQHKVRNVLYVPDFSGMAVIGTELRHFFHDQLLAVEIKNNLAQPVNYYTKRVFDYACGLLLFAVFLVPLAVFAVLIRLNSKGPAFYRQERIGKGTNRFQCYKFRTMYEDADSRLEEILNADPEARKEWEKHWKLKNDSRVTSIGRLLRRTSLDELPQIINVLNGEMSLVGPRPYLPREWDDIRHQSEAIHSVLPGITGLWQVSGRSESTPEERMSLDAWYVRNWNVWLDIVILFKTIKVVISMDGAR